MRVTGGGSRGGGDGMILAVNLRAVSTIVAFGTLMRVTTPPSASSSGEGGSTREAATAEWGC
jgi:hypothetical protein